MADIITSSEARSCCSPLEKALVIVPESRQTANHDLAISRSHQTTLQQSPAVADSADRGEEEVVVMELLGWEEI